MHLLFELAHFNLNDFFGISRGTDYRGDRQCIDVPGQFDAASNLFR